jgi:hypothetical protein
MPAIRVKMSSKTYAIDQESQLLMFVFAAISELRAAKEPVFPMPFSANAKFLESLSRIGTKAQTETDSLALGPVGRSRFGRTSNNEVWLAIFDQGSIKAGCPIAHFSPRAHDPGRNLVSFEIRR